MFTYLIVNALNFKHFVFRFRVFVDIKRNPIGQQILPLPYLKLYFNKKENVTWERMYQIANEDYREKQKKLLNRIREHERKKEAQRLAKEKEQKEKEQKAKEEVERAEERSKKLLNYNKNRRRENEKKKRLKMHSVFFYRNH